MTIEIHHESLAAHISVVIVTFNSAGVLETCLASIPDGDNRDRRRQCVGRHRSCQNHRCPAQRPAHREPGQHRLRTRLQSRRGSRTHGLPVFSSIPTSRWQRTRSCICSAPRCANHPVSPSIPASWTHGRPVLKRRSILLPRSQFPRRQPPAEDREIPVLSGAAIFVRRSDFAAVEGFDPGIVLYHEDDDLSFRLRRDRGSLMYVHDAVIEHIGGRIGRKKHGHPVAQVFRNGQVADICRAKAQSAEYRVERLRVSCSAVSQSGQHPVGTQAGKTVGLFARNSRRASRTDRQNNENASSFPRRGMPPISAGQGVRMIPGWKLRRELKRLVGKVTFLPMSLLAIPLSTPYYDFIVSRKRTTTPRPIAGTGKDRGLRDLPAQRPLRNRI